MKLFKLLVILIMTLSSAVFASSTNVNGTISGLVTDSKLQAISDVQVTATDTKTNYKRSNTTDANGRYSLQLPIGIYTVETKKQGILSQAIIDVRVSLGSTYQLQILVATNDETLEEVLVLGESLNLNRNISSSGLNISIEDVALLPIARNIESVALLAPGAVQGDGDFGNLISFSGSGVAENTYYINGLNVTNFRNGLGGSSVPFEFYKDFEIKSGGYSVEFGRSTGGVLNAVTKKGNNDLHYGIVSHYFIPSLRGKSPNTYFSDGDIYDDNQRDKRSLLNTDVYLSGPIIKDKLFFYGLYQNEQYQADILGRAYNPGDELSSWTDVDRNVGFYGMNLFWNINDKNSLSLTSFSDKRQTDVNNSSYDYNATTVGDLNSTTYLNRGGDNSVLRWEGQITDRLNLSALYGVNKYNLTTQSSKDVECSNVLNSSSQVIDINTNVPLTFVAGCARAFTRTEISFDEREAFRFDGEYKIGNHTIRGGIDKEINTSFLDSIYPGPHAQYYRYYDGIDGVDDFADDGTTPLPATELTNGYVFTQDQNYVRTRYFSLGGSFETIASAIYLEDIWRVSDNFTARLGLRSESFDNKNGIGETFIKMNHQLAPRIALNYDLPDQTSQVFMNWGRYHLPVANNTNVKLAGARNFYEEFFTFDLAIDSITNTPISIDENGIPTGTQLGDRYSYSTGVTPDPLSKVDHDIGPMYQDEIILGYHKKLNQNWNLGLKYTYRDIKSIIDDLAIKDTGIFVLSNPGTDLTIDIDGVTTNFTAEELGLDEAKRRYQSIEVVTEREWDNNWSLNASYAWASSVGNYEGLVKSDNGQSGAGLTTDFDFPALMDGAYGSLPNERKHTFKLRGNYRLNQQFTLGANAIFQTGRPLNKFGRSYPDENSTHTYGSTYYTFENNEYIFNPRGSQGNLPSILTIDLNTQYKRSLFGGDFTLSLDVLNLLDANKVTDQNEFAETSSGVVSPRYELPLSYQLPRRVRIGASLRF